MSEQRHRVLVVFGGQSSEHEISCLSAASALAALDPQRYDVVGVAITKEGTWHRWSPERIAGLRVENRQLPQVSADTPLATLVRGADGVRLYTIKGDRLVDPVVVDVAFALLHGAYGEDGTIQGMFEMLGLPYVGSGVASSAIGMDKHFMKLALEFARVPITPYEVVFDGQWRRDRSKCLRRVIDHLTFPVFVKPARAGSSVGISRVDEPNRLAEAIECARRFDPKVLVETGVMDGREIECAVLGSLPGSLELRTSLPGEIVVHDPKRFYDYEAKYLPTGEVDLLVPAQLPQDTIDHVRNVARRAFKALDCEGLVRVDTFVLPDGRVIVNELNSMPGFTALSMFPSLWEATGMPYGQLLDDLIGQALARPATVVR